MAGRIHSALNQVLLKYATYRESLVSICGFNVVEVRPASQTQILTGRR